jgi:ubiquinone/menaquinone biosynthesis C-methylase UbiE
MENRNQKKAFVTYEANAWFNRNRSVLLNYNKNKDRIVGLIGEYNIPTNTILEIGCSAGYRLNAIKENFIGSSVFGIEPSTEAIKYGREHFPKVNFTEGTADNLASFDDESMDVVIVGFVFYVIDRNIFFKVIAEVDRVLKNGGVLIIVDFFSETALKNTYEHIKEFTAFSFKQNYDEVFTASKLYYLLDKSTWNHSKKVLDASDNYHDKYSVTLLKKDIIASYK